MKKYSKEDQKLMATWALDCAERVLYLFEKESANDKRPRTAINVGRKWVKTDEFRMNTIRKASLDAHSSARDVNDTAARYAAHAAGQAVATAHVTQHAYGGAYYALKAIAEANPNNQEYAVINELEFESSLLPEHLRSDVMSRLIVTVQNGEVKVKLAKGPDF